MKRVRIVSSGYGHCTHVFNEDGTEIPVKSVTWHVATGGPTVATLEVSHVKADVTARLVDIEAFDEMLATLKAATHALSSYKYGNASPDLAEEIITKAASVIRNAEGR